MIVFDKILSLDLEITRRSKLIRIGAVLGEQTFSRRQITGLSEFAQDAGTILGHNILHHDLPWLQQQGWLTEPLSTLPVIDTLFLSPLAFPKNPYHRLVKDYKLVKDTYNDPVADARLALSVFKEQLEAFEQQRSDKPLLIELYHHLFSQDTASRGLANVFAQLIKQAGNKTNRHPPNHDNNSTPIADLITAVVGNTACPNQLANLIQALEHKTVSPLCLAYAIAWLQVAGSNSVLPAWVWRQYPAVKTVIKQLRSEHCQNESCEFCRDNFDAQLALNRYFEFDQFRKSADGSPLQQQIVESGIAGMSLLGVLPTSGGKSLCYQLPALVRNQQNASLAIVISPLQALMKDQVDNLKSKVGIESTAAIYGMLTMPERTALLEQVRMGDISLLYLSPEQLRNRSVKRAIKCRQISAWVFDEAHCLSKWGNDFRPDYLYCARVIGEFAKDQSEPPPPILCYTATAKQDVIEDICQHFNQELGITLKCFEGGVARDNLSYAVLQTKAQQKAFSVMTLLENTFSDEKPGSCVIYCATRRNVESLAEVLEQQQALPVTYFHAGLEATEKRSVLDAFIRGDYRVVVATNAFGMGIDKDDVRLVIHCDIPGSLENYIQEAGRAGRDRADATCILLFDQQDIEQQFRITKQSEIRLKDIREILKEIRYRAKYAEGNVIATSKELLRSDYVQSDIAVDEPMADTKVKTAIAWLEREEFLTREDNVNTVFQGKPVFATLDDAKPTLDELKLTPNARQRWETILNSLIQHDLDKGINADDILDRVITDTKDAHEKNKLTPELIMKTLAQMAGSGLVSRGFLMTAFIRPKGRDNCRQLFDTIRKIENQLLQILPELVPGDLVNAKDLLIDVRQINTCLQTEHELPSSTRIVRHLLKTWVQDGKASGKGASINLRFIGRERYHIECLRNFKEIEEIAFFRQQITHWVIMFLYEQLDQDLTSAQKKVMIEFTLEDAIGALSQAATHDLLLKGQLSSLSKNKQREKLLELIQRALLFLDNHKAIELQNGMAIFKQAMEINVPDDSSKRYVKANYQLLADHYQQKIIQVHVMYEYAKIGLDAIHQAQQLVSDYFDHLNKDFVAKYFKNRKGMLDRATSQESWTSIVVELHNTDQQAIVHAKSDENQLVLAGPGSGKTKVIIHRIAYLMRVEQIPARKILVLTFNHAAATSLHQRLTALLGSDAHALRVYTFHGLAMRLLGQYLEPDRHDEDIFKDLITRATRLLQGEEHDTGIEPDHQRLAMLDGIEFLLIDEYQDITQDSYEFVAALAGKTLADDEKLSIMAVGDDDQSIYKFLGSNVHYIREFQQDYQAKARYLVQNYRSTANIIAASNQLIDHNQDRIKSNHDIEINHSRRLQPSGGRLATLEGAYHGDVITIQCKSTDQQANEVLNQVQRILQVDAETEFDDIAVIARNGIDKPVLERVRSVFYKHKIPHRFAYNRDASFQLYTVRELVVFRTWLKEQRNQMLSTADLRQWLPNNRNDWHQVIEQLIASWEGRFGHSRIEAIHFEQELNDYLTEKRKDTRVGRGILLSTVHGVKGEEFKYVLVLDGDWARGSSSSEQEEERRLFYVAMTRAIDQLILFNVENMPNPHLPLLDSIIKTRVVSRCPVQLTSITKFITLGLPMLFLSFPGRFNPKSPSYAALERITVNDEVNLVKTNHDTLDIHIDGTLIARLSKSGYQKTVKYLHYPIKARVIAVVQRIRGAEERVTLDTWWLPIIDIAIQIPR